MIGDWFLRFLRLLPVLNSRLWSGSTSVSCNFFVDGVSASVSGKLERLLYMYGCERYSQYYVGIPSFPWWRAPWRPRRRGRLGRWRKRYPGACSGRTRGVACGWRETRSASPSWSPDYRSGKDDAPGNIHLSLLTYLLLAYLSCTRRSWAWKRA